MAYFIRARENVEAYWPQHLVALPDMAVLDRIWIAPAATINDPDVGTLRWSSALVFEALPELGLTLVDGLSVSLGEADLALEFPIEVLADYSQPTAPTVQVTIGPLPLVVTLQSALLRPAAVDNSQDPPLYTPLEAPLSLQFGQVTVMADLSGEIGLQGQIGVALPPVFIGETGIVVEALAITPILNSTTARPPELDSAWRGLLLDDARLVLTGDLGAVAPSEIFLDQASIGSGGFSGSVAVSWPVDPAQPFDADARTLAGFGFRLEELGITLVQNTLVGTTLAGYLQVPFFDAPLRVTLALTQTGALTVGLDLAAGAVTLRKPGVVAIDVSALTLEREGGDVALVLSGAITPEIGGAALEWPTLGVDGLRITTDGQVSIAGTWLELPEQKTFDFHSFQVEISRIGFGNEDVDGADYRWVGFSGGIQLVEGLPLRGSVDGLKVLWNENDARLQVSGIALAFEVPNVLTFEGFARFENDPEPLFAGGVAMTIHPLNGLGLDAQFATGKAVEGFRYFYLSVDVSLPFGIPLGPPVLGLYGFAGLYAQNMTLDYTDLVDYEDPADRPSMTDVALWQKQKGAMALGAGVTLATVPDNGFTVKVKALLAVLVPGPVVLLEGHAGLLSTKDSTVLRLLAVFDGISGTVLINISTSYAYPKDSGDLITIGASAEALFPFDGGDWHVYLGQDTPESKRIRADILTGLFEAQTYLMVDPDRLRFGVWVGYELHEKFGPLRLDLEAWLDGALTISRMPFQADGRVTLFGGVELGAGPVSVGLSVQASVAVEVPKPFSIWAEMTFELKTPLGNPKATVTLEWEKAGTPAYPLPLGASHGISHRKIAENWSMDKASAYALDADGLLIGPSGPPAIGAVPMVPPDVELVLNFDKPVKDEAGFPGASNAPAPEAVGKYDFTFSLRSVRLEYRQSWSQANDDGAWLDYGDFTASLDPEGDRHELSGFWQADPSAQAGRNTQLVLNATTPFSVARLLDQNQTLMAFLGVNQPQYPCGQDLEKPRRCVDFEDLPADPKRSYQPILIRDRHVFLSDFPMVVLPSPSEALGTEHALTTQGGEIARTVTTCLLIPKEAESGPIKLRVVRDVAITAPIVGDGHIRFAKGLTGLNGKDTELELRNPSGNQRRCQFLWPTAAFPDLPDWVEITAFIPKTPVGPEHPQAGILVFEAFNLDNKAIDWAGYSGPGGEIVRFRLQAKGETIHRVDSTLDAIVVIEVCHGREVTSDFDRLLIFAPEPLAEAELYFTIGSTGTVFLYDEADAELRRFAFTIRRQSDGEAVLAHLADQAPFRSLAIEGSFELIRLCRTSVEDYATWSDNLALATSTSETLEEIWGLHSDKVLYPGLFYRLTVSTTAKRRRNNGDWAEQDFEEHLYFKTGNPPGADDLALATRSPGDAGYHGREALADLAAYVATSVPPAADADVAQTAAYRSYDVGVIFNESYVELMYRMAELPLSLRLIDSNGQPLRDAAGVEISLDNAWGDNAELVLSREETQYQTLHDANCSGISTAQTETTQHVLAGSRDLLLAPQMRYGAELRAGDDFTAYRFSFLTSRYASFRHHAHSFIDAAWDHFRLRDEPGYVIDPVAFAAALALTEDDATAFERLFALFDLAPRGYPERLEITVLNDRDADYGFLLESPEALDWSRLGVALSTANPAQPVSEWRIGPVKLIDAELVTFARNPSPDYNRQWVELMVQQDIDLTGHVLDAAAAADPESFAPLFMFPAGSLHRAGTVLRVHMGADPGSDPQSREDVYLYADHGESRLAARSMTLRLTTADGTVLHARPFQRGLGSQAAAARVIPSADGARAFLIPLAANGTPRTPLARSHRLELTWQRDLGPQAPVLKRFGFTDPERATLHFDMAARLP